MSRIVIGCDPSSKKIAFVVGTDGGKFLRVVVKWLPDPAPVEVKCDWAERHTRNVVKNYVNAGHDVYFFTEDPALGRGGAHATILQARVSGGILIGARRAGAIEMHGANNSRWKAQVCGNGRIPKSEIPKYVQRTWPMLYQMAKGDPDACDAGCIQAYGVKVLKLEKRIKQHKETEDGDN